MFFVIVIVQIIPDMVINTIQDRMYTLLYETILAAKFWKMPGKFQNLAAKFF